jgi:hypothetical protein
VKEGRASIEFMDRYIRRVK